jgi:hypothetical protein
MLRSRARSRVTIVWEEIAGTARAKWLFWTRERIVQPAAAGQAKGGCGKSL